MSTPLKAWQTEAIVELLTSETKRDDAKLIDCLMKEGKITRESATATLASYRENPHEGAISVMLRQVKKDRFTASKFTPTIPPHPLMSAPIENIEKPVKPMRPEPKAPPVAKQEKVDTQAATPITIMSGDRQVKNPENGTGKIAEILRLYNLGFTKAQLMSGEHPSGIKYNKNTVYRQVGEFEKRKKGLPI